MTHADGPERLLKIGDVAELANVDRTVVERLIRTGHLIPDQRTAGGTPLFTKAQVLQVLQDAQAR